VGKLSEKIFPEELLRERVTIRVLPQKMQIYPRFKELVTEILGSDVCFVTTSLWEAFLQAMDQNPPADQPIEMKFLRQNVQINIGCQFLYQPKKSRRTPASKTWTGSDPSFPFYVERDKNPLLPELLDQWENLSGKSKEFWIQRFKEKGIIPKDPSPSVSTPGKDKPLKKFFKLLENSMTFVTAWLKRKLWSG
jgi:hypothetical protein